VRSGLEADEGDASRGVLLPFDQFEEVLRSPRLDDMERLASLLCAASASGVVSIATIRTDSFQEMQRAPLAKKVAFALFSLGPILSQDLASVVREPGRVAGFTVDEALIRQAAADAPSGDLLPLLAFTLNRIWRDHGASGRLTLDHYHGSGGVVGSIRSEWDQAGRDARKSEAHMVAVLVPRLATVNSEALAIRRTAKASEFDNGESEALNALVQRRLLVVDAADDGARFDIPHEAILRALPQIAVALNERAGDIQLIDELENIERRFRSAGDDQRDTLYLSVPAKARKTLASLAETPGWKQRIAGLERSS
jgi:hypothetical protein